jgi:hypothetical protein
VSCGSVVLVDQPAEHLLALDPRREVDDLISAVVRWQLLPALVRPMVVVVGIELDQTTTTNPCPNTPKQ